MLKIHTKIKTLIPKSAIHMPALLFLVITLFAGCHDTTSPANAEYEINNVLNRIKTAFLDYDINTLMLNIHPDYLHNGMSRIGLRELWLDRMAEYLLIEFQNIQVDIQDDEAVVSFTMKLQKANETIYSNEPETHGDISYFIRDSGSWSVYGNQENFRSFGSSRGQRGESPH